MNDSMNVVNPFSNTTVTNNNFSSKPPIYDDRREVYANKRNRLVMNRNFPDCRYNICMSSITEKLNISPLLNKMSGETRLRERYLRKMT